MARNGREDGPQLVTLRGQDVAVVMSVEEFDQLVPKSRATFVSWRALHLGGLDLEREADRAPSDQGTVSRSVCRNSSAVARIGTWKCFAQA